MILKVRRTAPTYAKHATVGKPACAKTLRQASRYWLYVTHWTQDFLLTSQSNCLTLYDMKTNTLTIRLDGDLNDLLNKASRRSGRNRSEIAREALRRQLRISQFDALRQRLMPFAEARGYLTDEDVFADVS